MSQDSQDRDELYRELGSDSDIEAVAEPDTETEIDAEVEPEADTEAGSERESDAVTTGDIVIDSALRDLAEVAPEDLDGHIEAAESLQATLQGRLSNLGE
ncbi:MAG: hypothetical protein Q4G67_10315 [Actinomycetia bacterium]|nr:hypothetical protein [Actinomycetes bacterium]